MENSDDASRLLAQARRFVNLFCAVPKTAFIIYFAFKTPHSPTTGKEIQHDWGAKLEQNILEIKIYKSRWDDATDNIRIIIAQAGDDPDDGRAYAKT